MDRRIIHETSANVSLAKEMAAGPMPLEIIIIFAIALGTMITIHDTKRACECYRMYNSRSRESARLILPDGTVAREWSHPQGFPTATVL